VTNPFDDFHPSRYRRSAHRAEKALDARTGVLGTLETAYDAIVRQELDRFAWLVEHAHVVRVYDRIVRQIGHLDIDRYEVDAFFDRLATSEEAAYTLPGPAGLFVAALINRCPERELRLDLGASRCRMHFLGYRLPEGKSLFLEGTAGDFAGAGVNGGRLVVNGSVGSWCGAGMLAGTIHVAGSAGPELGAWMHGGRIRVDGAAATLGGNRYGGEVTVGQEGSRR
jgi:hypothetical protein